MMRSRDANFCSEKKARPELGTVVCGSVARSRVMAVVVGPRTLFTRGLGHQEPSVEKTIQNASRVMEDSYGENGQVIGKSDSLRTMLQNAVDEELADISVSRGARTCRDQLRSGHLWPSGISMGCKMATDNIGRLHRTLAFGLKTLK